MRSLLSYDSETWCFEPGRQVPKPAVGSCAVPGFAPRLLCGVDACAEIVGRHLLGSGPGGGGDLVGHAVDYDLASLCAHAPQLIPPIFSALEEGRIHCTLLRQQLIEIAKGCFKGRGPAPFAPAASEDEEDDEEESPKPAAKGEKGKKGSKGKPWWGSYSLAAVMARTVGGDPLRKDLYRTEFALWDGLPEESFPAGPKAYALRDASEPLAIYDWQERTSQAMGGVLDDEAAKVRAFFALRLWAVWGIRTDAKAVARLRAHVEGERAAARRELVAAGLVAEDFVVWKSDPIKRRVEEGGRKIAEVRARIVSAYTLLGLEIPMTDPKPREGETPAEAKARAQVSWSSQACEESGDPVLERFADLSALEKILSTDIPVLERGVWMPIHPRFNLVETGRTSCSDPNLQNLRRFPGIRECFVPRPGCVFVSCDYGMLELCTLAQTCLDLFGWSRLADALNQGLDPHLAFAATMLGISYDEAKARRKEEQLSKDEKLARGVGEETPVTDARQLAKVFNFGLPGGMGAAKFSAYARGQRPDSIPLEKWRDMVSISEVERFKKLWQIQWPEMRLYFDRCNTIAKSSGAVFLPRSRRLRGNLRFTQVANTQFQGPGSDVALAAVWLVTRRCYLDPGPMLGGRAVNLVHDEIVCEVPRERAVAFAEALKETMLEAARPWLPGVKIGASVTLSDRLSKKAEESRDEQGRLQVVIMGERHAKDKKTHEPLFDVRGEPEYEWYVERKESA